MSNVHLENNQNDRQGAVWRPSLALLIIAALIFPVLLITGSYELHIMWVWWLNRPEYSHGILMPLIAAFLIWQQRDVLEQMPFARSWWGVVLTLMAMTVLMMGKLGSVIVLVQYAFVITLAGLGLSLVGWNMAKRLFVPFFMLLLMVPLPEFISKNLTANLQLVSSQLGVAFIRMFNVSVYLEGNVIDLGTYKLEVAEACSGLRYLFPLMTLGFIMAHFYKAAFWKRCLIFFSSIPITILMNSLRIGAIGLLVDRWGQSMAEGFLHDFEGWLIFMASGAVLLLEVALVSRIGADQRPWREIFGFEFPAPVPVSATRKQWQPTITFVFSSVLVMFFSFMAFLSPSRTETIPVRQSFAEFPLQIAGWVGRRETMDPFYLAKLKLDDYIMVNYEDTSGSSTGDLVQFYSAWYDSQRGGESVHSPKSCIPGGGWQIVNFDQVTLSDINLGDKPIRINRVLIGKGASKQLVYYWFQQRGRVVTNEYLVKWFLFWDSLTRNRTDGALIRLLVPIPEGKSVESVEQGLKRFTSVLVPRLDPFIPR